MRTRAVAVVALGLGLWWTVAAGGAGEGAVEALLERRGEAFVAAFNAPEDAARETFARQHMGTRLVREGLVGRFVETLRANRDELGPLDRHSVRVLNDGALVFVYGRSARTGAWVNYQFRVLAEDEHRLSLAFRATAIEPLEMPNAALGSAAAGDYLRRLEANLEAQQPFSGVILVRRQGEEVFSRVQGMADAARGVPMARTSRLGMASGSKLFTAIAVLQLAEAGKLDLEQPLARTLPSFPNQEFARRATLRQLLTHTAGAGNYWDDEYERHWGEITRLDQMLPFVLRHLGETPSGTFSYANSGFILLGLVVEAVSGQSFYDYVQQHIFAPAGMRSTGFPVRGDGSPDLAVPYLPVLVAGAVEKGKYEPVELGARGTSAGGAVTTADDLLRFADALKGGLLLGPSHLRLLMEGQVPYAGKDSWYGCGTIVESKRGVRSYGHGGMARGTQFELRIYPDLDTVLIVMSNYDTIAGPEMAAALDGLITNGARP